MSLVVRFADADDCAAGRCLVGSFHPKVWLFVQIAQFPIEHCQNLWTRERLVRRARPYGNILCHHISNDHYTLQALRTSPTSEVSARQRSTDRTVTNPVARN
jgi:hypothetical protein